MDERRTIPFRDLGRFGLIYADPPWDYSDKGHTRRIDRQYQPMTLEAICALPVASLAELSTPVEC